MLTTSNESAGASDEEATAPTRYSKHAATALMALLGTFVLGGLLICGILYLARNPSVEVENCGDAVLHDKGAISYFPRYTLRLPPVPLERGRASTFRIDCQLPNSALTPRLLVTRRDYQLSTLPENEWLFLRRQIKEAEMGVTISAQLFKEQEPVYLITGDLGQDWRAESRGNERFFSASQVGGRIVNREPDWDGIQFSIKISQTKPREIPQGLQLIPVLVGGGFRK